MRRVLALLLSVVFAASACGDTELPELEAGPADTLPAPELTDVPTSTPSVPEREVVAYCRGPYCVLAFDAVARLREQGVKARRLEDGFPEWKQAGLPVESE